MKQIVLAIILLLSTSLSLFAAKPIVFTIDLKQEVGSTSWIYMQEGFKQAQQNKADRIIIHENTYGGLVLFADSIRTLILNSKIPVSIFIDNNAASAGALIAIACDSIYMRSGANIGAATVVNQEQQKMPDKYQSYMRATIRATAEAKGKIRKVINGDTVEVWRRDPRLAEAMVDENLPSIAGIRDSGKIVTLTADEAIAKGFCEAKVESIHEIIEERWGWDNYEIRSYQPSLYDDLRGFLTNPALQAILIMIIIGGIYFELQSPGIGLPAIIAIGAAFLYFTPLFLQGLADYWEIALFIIGVVLLIMEIFVIPGFGVAGILGTLFTASGLILALVNNINFDFSGVEVTLWSEAIWTVVFGLLGSFALILLLASKIGTQGIFKRLALQSAQNAKEGFTPVDEPLKEWVGYVGVTETDMRPVGKIRIHDELLDAKATSGFIEKGVEIKVERIEAGLLIVRKATSKNQAE